MTKSFKRFAFKNAAGSSRGQGDWCCPNCGGDCFGSSGVTSITYYCHGNSMGTKTEQTPSCGYWETGTEPRMQGVR